MSIQINLLQEHLQQQKERRSDPLRIGIMILTVLIASLLGLYLFKLSNVRKLEKEKAELLNEWNSKSTLMEEGKVEEVELQAKLETSNALLSRAESRFYWGPLFEQFLTAVPKEVQLTSLSGKTNSQTKDLLLTITGVGAGEQPRQDVENFRQELIKTLAEHYPNVTGNFRELEDDSNRINFEGKKLATAKFKIEVQIKYGTVKETTP